MKSSQAIKHGIDSLIIQVWDESTRQWNVAYKELFTYDANGNMIQSDGYGWEESTSDWVPIDKLEYTYDTSYARSDLILPYFNDDISIIEAMDIHELFDHKMNSFLGSAWDESSEDWIPNLKGDYFYSEQNVSAVNETEEEISRIYPNPCADYIAFSFSDNFHQITLKLFDLQGRKLLTRAIKNHEIIRLEDLENGIYVYELLTGDGKIQSGRLIKL